MVITCPSTFIFAATLVLVTFRCAAAEPPAASAAAPPVLARSDRMGDPLPDGAVLRLGTTRLRQRQGVNGVTFSPDGKYLVSTGWGDSIRFWEVATGREVRRLRAPEGEGTFAAAFSPDGALLVSVGEQGWVRLWDLETGKIRFETVGHRDQRVSHAVRVYGVSFAPDGLTFATAGADPAVRVWDVATGVELLELQDDGGSDSHPVAFSPDGQLLASGSLNGTIRLWNLNSGGEPTVIQAANNRDITSLAFTPDGQHLISSGITYERTGENSVRTLSQIHVWDASNGTTVGQFQSDEVLLGDCSLALSADGNTLCSSHHDKVVIWDVATRRARQVIQTDSIQLGGLTHGLAISPDGKIVASRVWAQTVRLWDTETGEAVLYAQDAHATAVIAVQFSPDGSQIVTGSADATARLWDANTGEHRRVVGKGSGWVRHVEFLPDGKHVVVGAETHETGAPQYHGEIKICSVSNGEVLHHFPTDSRVMCGAVSPDGQRIVVATGFGKFFSMGTGESPDVHIHTWNLDAPTAHKVWSANERRISQLAFHRESHLVWSVDEDGVVRQWDVRSGDELRRMDPISDIEPGMFLQSAFAPDVAFVIIGGLLRHDPVPNRGELSLMATSTGERKWSQSFSQHWPQGLAVSQDGRIVAGYLRPTSRSESAHRITLRSVDDGHEIHAIDLDDGWVRSMAFSPDGTKLVTGMDRGDALVWDVSSYVAR